jgi:hypothetical protein
VGATIPRSKVEEIMAELFCVGSVLLLLLTLTGILRIKIWDDESRIVNATWLDSKDKFHLLSRWGANY